MTKRIFRAIFSVSFLVLLTAVILTMGAVQSYFNDLAF